ncbi:MAG: ankyrin repeat domain-containing protein [Sedimenticola sp.]
MGIFGRSGEQEYLESVCSKFCLELDLSQQDFSESDEQILYQIILSLRDKGLSVDDSVGVILQLSSKHGDIFEALDNYGQMFFGVPTNEGRIKETAIRKHNYRSFTENGGENIHEAVSIQIEEIMSLYPEPLSSSIIEGDDLDKIPHGKGQFGSVNNPIPVNGAIGEIKYLSKLRNSSGAPYCFHRIGSFDSDVSKFPVDCYEIFSLDKTDKRELYFDMYHPRRSSLAPAGLTIESLRSQNSLTDKPYGYGVDSSVDNFPLGLIGEIRELYGSEIGVPLEDRIKKVFENECGFDHEEQDEISFDERIKNKIDRNAILSYTASIDKVNSEGLTKLMIVAQKGSINDLIELIAKGADPTVKSKNGLTASRLALRAKKKNNYKILKSAETWWKEQGRRLFVEDEKFNDAHFQSTVRITPKANSNNNSVTDGISLTFLFVAGAFVLWAILVFMR